MSRVVGALATILLLLVATAAPVSAELPPTPGADMPAFEDPDLQRRYVALLRELRCMVCQNESLAESRAGLARDLRRVVYREMEAGRSEAEILAFVTARYGDFVHYRPPLRPSTWLLWYGPAGLLLVGAATVVALGMRRSRRGPAASLDEAARRRAAALLGETEDRGRRS
jgi:cytochrome c-type biogenesis protein CcmH